MSHTSFRHEFLDRMERLLAGVSSEEMKLLRLGGPPGGGETLDLVSLALLALMEQIEGKPLLIRSTEPPTSEPT